MTESELPTAEWVQHGLADRFLGIGKGPPALTGRPDPATSGPFLTLPSCSSFTLFCFHHGTKNRRNKHRPYFFTKALVCLLNDYSLSILHGAGFVLSAGDRVTAAA